MPADAKQSTTDPRTVGQSEGESWPSPSHHTRAGLWWLLKHSNVFPHASEAVEEEHVLQVATQALLSALKVI